MKAQFISLASTGEVCMAVVELIWCDGCMYGASVVCNGVQAVSVSRGIDDGQVCENGGVIWW